MTDAELIYLLRMHISDIKWHREPDLSEGTVKVLGEAVDAVAARLAQPTPESVVELARKRWPERKLAEAAVKALEFMAHGPDCNLRYYHTKQECTCGYTELRNEIKLLARRQREREKMPEPNCICGHSHIWPLDNTRCEECCEEECECEEFRPDVSDA